LINASQLKKNLDIDYRYKYKTSVSHKKGSKSLPERPELDKGVCDVEGLLSDAGLAEDCKGVS